MIFAAQPESGVKMLLLVVFLFTGAGEIAAAPAGDVSARLKSRVVIQDSERHELVSGIVDDTFKVHVYLPRGYYDMNEPIPAVYLLDAEYSFGAVAYTVRRLIKDNLIPPVLLVGVAYEVPYEEYYRRRERDFTPTAAHLDDFPNAGRGEYFARFLRRELVPFVESTYSVDPENRTIKRLEEVLEERSYEGLDYRVKLFPEETHRTVFPIAVSHGLRFVLSEGG